MSATITWISNAIEIAGIATMVIGLLLAAIFAGSELRARGGGDIYVAARRRIGKAILLALELLVAADILRTVTEMPSLSQVAVLAGIVGIRTFLSFALEIELTGRVPWRRPTNSEMS